MWFASCFQRRTAASVPRRSKRNCRPAPRGRHATPQLQVEQLEHRWCPSYSLITSRTALAGTDSVNWGTLGTPGTCVASPFTILSTGGKSISVSKSIADDFGVGEEYPPATAGQFNGNFAPGDLLLESECSFLLTGKVNPITLNFGTTAVAAGGAQIQSVEGGTFTAQVNALDAKGKTLASFTEVGNSTSAADNSAIFIGISSSSANIYQIVLEVTNVALKSDFAINKFDFRTSATAAAPASLQVASALEPAPIPASLLGAGQVDKPAAQLYWPAPPAAPQAGAGIAPPASDSVSALHTSATDAVFAGTAQAANDDDAWLFGWLAGCDVVGI